MMLLSSRVPEKKKSLRTGRRRGQSLVEFSLSMPILLIIVTGMVGFGLALYNNLVLTNGVNIGAQTLAASRGQTSDPCATASSAVQTASPSLVSSNLSYTIILNGTTYTGTTCTSGATNMVQGATLQVSATYPCVLPIYGMKHSCSLGALTAELIQ